MAKEACVLLEKCAMHMPSIKAISMPTVNMIRNTAPKNMNRVVALQKAVTQNKVKSL